VCATLLDPLITYVVLLVTEIGARDARALHERSVVAAFPGAADPGTKVRENQFYTNYNERFLLINYIFLCNASKSSCGGIFHLVIPSYIKHGADLDGFATGLLLVFFTQSLILG